MGMQIRQFTQPDTSEIIALVLHYQNDGTRPVNISVGKLLGK